MSQQDILLYGYGTVGQALHSIIRQKDRVCIVDPKNRFRYTEIPNLEGFKYCFVCVPTPTTDGEFDETNIFNVLDDLAYKGFPGIVVLVSTTLPTTVKELTYDYQNLKIVTQPEFISENNSFCDIQNTDVIVLGGDYRDLYDLMIFYKTETTLDVNDNNFVLMKADEAMMMKYIWNIHNAYEILFWNFVSETTQDPRKYISTFQKLNKSISPDLTQVCADGKPGFGGKCFPKDLSAFKSQFPHELLEFMKNYNSRLRNAPQSVFESTVEDENEIEDDEVEMNFSDYSSDYDNYDNKYAIPIN